jgi:hypothetical protein
MAELIDWKRRNLPNYNQFSSIYEEAGADFETNPDKDEETRKNQSVQDFPNRRNEKNAHPHALAVYVPSTQGNNAISPQEFKNRISETQKVLSRVCGGGTQLIGFGSWKYEQKRGTEPTAIIQSSCKTNKYNKHDLVLKRFLRKKKEDWKQDSMGFSFNGKMYLLEDEDLK